MTVIHNSHSRRQFLRGTGGFLLALPILPSLLPQRAQAQATPRAPRFIAFATEHGAIFNSRMWPADATLTEKQKLYDDHTIQRGKLTLRSDGARTGFSDVLQASPGLLTAGLAAKLNAIRGLDIPFYIAHHGGGHLGNYAVNQGTADVVKAQPRPTIDQVMAWSPSFYKDLSTIKERYLHVGSVDTDPRFCISWGYENSSTRTGVAMAPPIFSAVEMFNRVFVPPMENGQPSRKPVVDHVLESYKRLRQGAFGDANRLSKADARRLDDHMDRLSELQRTLNVTASCGTASPPPYDANNHTPLETMPDKQSEWYQIFNDVIVAGMICGTTRIATVHATDTFDETRSGDDWHLWTAHVAFQQPEKQNKLVSANQRFFETVFLDLAAKLDIEEADGKTYLDNSLIMWSQESGMEVHESVCHPVVTAGSAGGYFNTGHYIDYSNRANTRVSYPDTPGTQERRPGVLYTQWLANVLKSMGVPPSEFEYPGEKGYGVPYRADTYLGPAPEAWPDRLFRDASNDLKFLVG